MQPGCIETLKQIVFVSTIESGSDNFKIGDTYLLLPFNLFLAGAVPFYWFSLHEWTPT